MNGDPEGWEMKKKILIADSICDALERERSILNRVSFEVITTLSGTEALSIHRTRHVDLIIASMELTDISGDDLCSLIRQDKELKDVSIILTCDHNPACVSRAADCGANAYITKPFHSEQLSEKVTALLSIPRRQSYRVLLKASVLGTDPDESFYCSTRDLSVSGMMIETERPLKKGQVLSLSFVLPGFGQITGEGEIMRIDTRDKVHGYGVHFRYMPHKHRQAVEAFIASRSGQQT